LTIPAVFRAEFVEGATVTRGIERCLVVYPAIEWQKLAEKIRQLPLTSQPARAFTRFIFSGAAICVASQAGQFPGVDTTPGELPSELFLPDQLRAYAQVDGEAIAVGLLSRVEIWSPERWQRVKSSFVEEGAALAEALSEFGV
jgi:MraZ protein